MIGERKRETEIEERGTEDRRRKTEDRVREERGEIVNMASIMLYLMLPS